mmetsp:Transcript_31869/g.74500  ORF Transcript_31869/g.74500 Transcript_31869/m.74500 type:complete len:811 (-) Transcript_31869:101-2533(-)|eukprot:CAMPEP_0178403954 /NCGR_PEP_ID=MMETSP0689_2-20121128/17633_1 /TAXON_ID=160604 /ORGANISM="Amphidinium massartii, Strain CS-259" /LENGTH=810 /DNA_ID=CAMNT_0020024921 /DNA_START=30 /DNA_END=2462 /DNA_ORIENTATION=-
MSAGLFDYWGVLGTGIQSFFAWATFNRDAFADNVAMRQNQKYQQKNYHISWIAIARDDIRDMMGISVNRINNYMIVATLILSIAAGAIVSVSFNAECPSFIVFAFYISLGISLTFLTLAIMFGVKGQNCAFTNTMKLLTYQVRPESPADYSHDYMRQVQWLERRGLTQLLRIPGVQPEYEHDSYKLDVETGGKRVSGPESGFRPLPKVMGKSEAAKPPDPTAQPEAAKPAEVGCFGGFAKGTGAAKAERGWKDEDGHFEDENLEDATPLESLMKRSTHTWYLTKFARFMGLWQPYDSYSKHAMGFGIIGLGQGSTYFALGTLLSTGRYFDEWPALLLAASFVFTVCVILVQNFTAHNDHTNFYAALVVLIAGPFFAAVVVSTDSKVVEQIFAPLCLLAHSLFWLGAWVSSKHVVEDKKLDLLSDGSDLWKTQLGQEAVQNERRRRGSVESITRVNGYTLKQQQERFRAKRWSRTAEGRDGGSAEAATGSSSYVVGYPPQSAAQSGGHGLSNPKSDVWPTDHEEFDLRQSSTVAKIKNTMQLTLLMAFILWFTFFLWSAVKYWWEPLDDRKPPELSTSAVAMSWPDPQFHPMALGCSNGRVFAADPYRIWRLDGDQSLEVRCDHPLGSTNRIADIAAWCPEDPSESCRVWALIKSWGDAKGQVIECAGNSSAVMWEGEATLIAIHEDGGSLNLLLERSWGHLEEFRWSESEGVWTPNFFLGSVANFVGDRLRSISAAGHRLLLFYDVFNGEVAVESLDIKAVNVRREWSLPKGTEQLLAGCSSREREAIILTGNYELRSRYAHPVLLRIEV